MINASNGMINLINGNARTFLARLIVNEEVLDCDILKITVNKGAGETLDAGSLFIPYMQATLMNCSDDLDGEDITLQIGMNVEGTDEWITMGCFTVTETAEAQGQIELTAVGFLNSKCGGSITVVSGTPYSSILERLEALTGLDINLIGTTVSGEYEGAFSLPARDALAEIAVGLGGFVTEDSNGGIVIAKHLSGTRLDVTDERCVNPPEVSETTVTEAGYTFRPAEMDLVLGDPRLEPWDYLRATVEGETITMLCQRLTHTFDGGLQTLVDCSRVQTSSTMKGSLEKAVENIIHNTYTKDEVNEIIDLNGYSVVIEITAIDYVLNTATLKAHVYYAGEEITEDEYVRFAYSWTKDDSETVLGVNQTLNVTDLFAEYTCTLEETDYIRMAIENGHLRFYSNYEDVDMGIDNDHLIVSSPEDVFEIVDGHLMMEEE